jgi:hypothetical protein
MIYPFVPNQQFPEAAQKLRFVWWSFADDACWPFGLGPN